MMGLSGLASLALLAAMAALGVGILYRLAPFLDAFEQWVYGSPYCSPPHAFKSDLGARACEISSPPVSACWSSSSSLGSYCGLAWTTFSLPALLFPSEIRATAAGFSAACAKVGATCGTLFLPMLTKAIGLQYTLAILAGLSGVAWLVTARLGAGLTTKKSPNHQDNCK
jgi:hypothetical protein